MELDLPRDPPMSGAREVDLRRRDTLVLVVPAEATCARLTNVGVRSSVAVVVCSSSWPYSLSRGGWLSFGAILFRVGKVEAVVQ